MQTWHSLLVVAPRHMGSVCDAKLCTGLAAAVTREGQGGRARAWDLARAASQGRRPREAST
eukprot:9544712-Alexandrium_andersonii.AAC.1